MSVKKPAKIVLLLFIVLVLTCASVSGFYYHSIEFDPAILSRSGHNGRGTIFTDRYGRELRFLPDEKGERARWVPLSEIPESVQNAFIAAEDERFREHPGFDAFAILRAVWSNITRKRIVSGASTISQQVVRLAYAGRPGADVEKADKNTKSRSYRHKLTEIVRSIKMELAFSKDEILEQYLNRAPMGNNLIGVETAARSYFGISVQNISLSEAALLASLPKAPGMLNPYGGGFNRLMERRNWVLGRMKSLRMISDDDQLAANSQKIRLRRLAFQSAAPHVVDMLLRDPGLRGKMKTTIDLDIQKRVQEILASHADRLKYRGASQAAAIVVDNASMEALASVGSIEYSAKDDGFNNGVRAFRSAGSTLKPFLYALAMESGDRGATTLLQDTERKYRSREGQYSPLNFDRREYGPVTMRAALGNSLNLSAVKMLERVGEDRFYSMLRRLNLINRADRGPEHYGLGMAIGNPEVSPEQLAAAYAMLANGGVYRPVRYLFPSTGPPGKSKNERYVLLPQTSYIITDMLSDPTARSLTFSRSRLMIGFPFKVAIKTGTSTFFRDLWAAGYTADYTVVVWAGNFNGSPTNNLTGSSAAVPIFSDIMTYLYRQSDPVPFKKPRGIRKVRVCGYSGMKPSAYCSHTIDELFITGTEPSETCTFHVNANAVRHELGASYAGWLYDKNITGSAGRFRLSGFGDDLNLVFDDPWDGASPSREPGIRPRNVAQQIKSPVKEHEPDKGDIHYRIGGSAPLQEAPSTTFGDTEIKIIYPLDRDRFVLNRLEGNQTIKLQAIVAESVPYVEWFMNGKFLKRTGPPYLAVWRLEEGKYRITAVAPSNAGDSVQIEVE